MKDRHIHTINGVVRAEGPKVQLFKEETTVVKLLKDLVEGQERLITSIEERWPPVSGPLFRQKPEPVMDPAPKPSPAPAAPEPPPVAESEPPPAEDPARPLESLGWKPNSAEYLAFTKRLPFPVNSVQEMLSRVRKADLLAAEWVGESIAEHIEDRLKARNAGKLLPDDWCPPEGPPTSMTDPALVYAVKRDTAIPQPPTIKKPYAGRTMTVEEIAAERKHLTVPQVQALLQQAEPHWNKHPHYLYHWALQRGYTLPKHQLVNRGKKKKA